MHNNVMPPRIGKYCCLTEKNSPMHTTYLFSMLKFCSDELNGHYGILKKIIPCIGTLHTCFLDFVTKKRLRLNSFLAGEFKILEVERFNCTTLLLEALILLVPPIIETWVSAAMDLGRVLVFLRSIGEKQNIKIQYY